jgi:hypothetical protein
MERRLAGRYLSDGGRVLFGPSSSRVEGHRCPLVSRGYSRDDRRGLEQIEYAVLADTAGRRVAVRVIPGDTGGPTAFVEAAHAVRETFGPQRRGHGRRPRADHIGAH